MVERTYDSITLLSTSLKGDFSQNWGRCTQVQFVCDILYKLHICSNNDAFSVWIISVEIEALAFASTRVKTCMKRNIFLFFITSNDNISCMISYKILLIATNVYLHVCIQVFKMGQQMEKVQKGPSIIIVASKKQTIFYNFVKEVKTSV